MWTVHVLPHDCDLLAESALVNSKVLGGVVVLAPRYLAARAVALEADHGGRAATVPVVSKAHQAAPERAAPARVLRLERQRRVRAVHPAARAVDVVPRLDVVGGVRLQVGEVHHAPVPRGMCWVGAVVPRRVERVRGLVRPPRPAVVAPRDLGARGLRALHDADDDLRGGAVVVGRGAEELAQLGPCRAERYDGRVRAVVRLAVDLPVAPYPDVVRGRGG